MIADKETRQALIALATALEKQHDAIVALAKDVSDLMAVVGKEGGHARKFARSQRIAESSSGILQLRHLAARLKATKPASSS
jgi:hypothetical protein